MSPQDTALLMAQLQSLLLQLRVQNGGKVITPKLNVTMACDATELEVEEEEITLELNIHYKGRKTTSVNHSSWCEQTRGVFGAVGQRFCQFASLQALCQFGLMEVLVCFTFLLFLLLSIHCTWS